MSKIEKIMDSIFGGWDDVIGKSIEEQAKYADHVSVSLATNEKFNEEQSIAMKAAMKSMSCDDYFSQWNPTSVGCLSYLILHAPVKYQKIYQEQHAAFTEWYQCAVNHT